MKVIPDADRLAEGGKSSFSLKPDEGEVIEEAAAAKRTTSLVITTCSFLMGLFLLGAVGALYAGFKEAENAITQIDYLALAAVLGIFARIAQAAKHHEEDRSK